MVASPTQTVTIDRISSNGNAIAQQQHAGKTIHVPAGEVGGTYDVKLVDKGSHFKAALVDWTEDAQPRQSGPGLQPDTSDIGKDLLNPGRNRSHSFTVRKSISGDRSVGQELRSRVSQRKH